MFKMMAIARVEFAIAKPIACATILRAVTVDPPIVTYININI